MTPRQTEELMGSSTGVPPFGCRLCDRGTKMVLYLTGVCSRDCFYCPLSEAKKGKDVIFANERPLDLMDWKKGMIEEARSMKALGTGITGGDPMLFPDRTCEAIRTLKQEFGPRHHVHLYTSGPFDARSLRKVKEAGLNEIRFHPPMETWAEFEFVGRDAEEGDAGDASIYHSLILEARALRLVVGLEVPSVVDKRGSGNWMSKGLFHLLRYAAREEMDFVNVNELEASHTNMDAFLEHSYTLVGDSMAVKGSMELALMTIGKVRTELPDSRTVFHVCSSVYKDSVQLRNRLRRMSKNLAREFEVATDDGTLIRGVMVTDDPMSVMARLSKEHGVPGSLMIPADGKLLIAPWVIEALSEDMEEECYISEVYPTWDALEVERTPLRRKPPSN